MNDGNSSLPCLSPLFFSYRGRFIWNCNGESGDRGVRDGGREGIIKCHPSFDATRGGDAIFVLRSLLAPGQRDMFGLIYVFSFGLHLSASPFLPKKRKVWPGRWKKKRKKHCPVFMTEVGDDKCDEQSQTIGGEKQRKYSHCRNPPPNPGFLLLPSPSFPPQPPFSATPPLPISSEAIMDVVCRVSLSADWISALVCANMCVCVREWSSYRLLVQ